MGYKIENFANAFDTSADATDDAADALENYGDAAAGLSGLDEINVVTLETATNEDAAGIDLTKVDSSILDAMEKYQDLSDGIAGTFSDLADKIATSLEGTLTATLFETLVSGLAGIGKAIDFVVDHWEAFEPIIKTLIDLLTIFLAIKVADTMLGWAKHFRTAFGALEKFSINLPVASKNLKGMTPYVNESTEAVSGLTMAFSAFTFAASQAIASSIFDRMSEDNRKIAAAITIAVAALAAGTAAWMAYHGAVTYGVAIPIITGAIGAGVAAVKALIPPVPQMATGGVVSQPTLAMVGEGRYNEAVVPLGNSPQFTSMKGEIAEEVARKLAQTPYSPYGSTSRGSQANVILQVNGRELARALLPDLGITRPQTGVKLV